jgi:hypothetical protein
MDDTTAADSALWMATIERARGELVGLPAAEQLWLAAQLQLIAARQEALDRLFRAIDGATVCRDCRGACCSRAKHHATLTNLLGYLLRDEAPPIPDFSLPCPFLDPQGCRLPVARRPFNCIIFFCEALDRRLSEAERAELEALARELRTLYEAIAARCPGASLRGLLIAAGRCTGRPLLTPVA